jgi:hypothetical protein
MISEHAAREAQHNAITPKIFSCFLIFISATLPAAATWKQEYGKSSLAVQEWFKNAELPKEGQKRLHFVKCCDQSDRFKTTFSVDRSTAGDAWFYEVDGKWVRIPDDVIHSDEIHARNPQDDSLPEFQQMRREGVLFVYNGKPTCFWPPEGGI